MKLDFAGIDVAPGVKASCSRRNPTGKPDDEQVGLVGSDGKLYSPVFNSLPELQAWLKDKGVEVIPSGLGEN